MRKKNNQIDLSKDQPTNVSTPNPIHQTNPVDANANANANVNLVTLSSTLAQIFKNSIFIFRSLFRFINFNLFKDLFLKLKYYFIENKFIFKYTFKLFKIMFYVFVYMFSATGVLMFGNIYMRYGGTDNIIIFLFDNFKLSLHDLYINLLTSIRDYIDTIIDPNRGQDTSSIPNSPIDNKPINPSNNMPSNKDVNSNNYYKKWLDELSRENYKITDTKEDFFKSPYFYIPLIIVSGIIIYYTYEYLWEYFNHIKPNDNINLNPSNENINTNVNTSDQPITSPQSSPISETSNLTVKDSLQNRTPISPSDPRTGSAVWKDIPSTSNSTSAPSTSNTYSDFDSNNTLTSIGSYKST